ncbi:MAG: HAMP domain-containing sensor histidine kinase [Myxococcota bacterium]
MPRPDALPCLLVIGPFPDAWPRGIDASAPVRRFEALVGAADTLATHWPDVVVVDAATATGELRDAVRDLEVPVLEVVAPGSAGRAEAPFTDVLVEPVTAPVLWRRAKHVDELFAQRRAARRQARLDESSTLMAGLAHELRNPIHALVQGLDALRRRLPDDLETRTARLVGILEQAATRIVDLLRDVQPISNLDAEPPGHWDPAQSVATALALLDHRSQGIELRVDVAPVPGVHGRPGLLDQVVLNLVDNALRAAGEGGWVEIRVGSQSDAVLLEVEDSGAGIAEGLTEEIFEPFVTTYKDQGGTGLGLHLCRRAVERHHGELWASSEPGRGAVFTVRLPTRPLVAHGEEA